MRAAAVESRFCWTRMRDHPCVVSAAACLGSVVALAFLPSFVSGALMSTAIHWAAMANNGHSSLSMRTCEQIAKGTLLSAIGGGVGYSMWGGASWTRPGVCYLGLITQLAGGILGLVTTYPELPQLWLGGLPPTHATSEPHVHVVVDRGAGGG